MEQVTAQEFRRRAREKLRDGGAFSRYLLGYLAQMVLVGVASVSLTGLLMGGGLLSATEGGELQLRSLDLAKMGPSFIASALVTFCFLYLMGFCQWGQRAMAIAAMRGGLKVSHAFAGWGHGWRMVSLMLWQSTFVMLWTLLLVVPGIRAAFSYAMAPYLLVDHPDWTARRCIAESKRLMEGNRLRLFWLGLSFFMWIVLVAVLSLVPMLGQFAQLVLMPYLDTSFAAFYEDLLDRDENLQVEVVA